MPVTTHHIQNVLRAYAKRLTEGKTTCNNPAVAKVKRPDEVTIAVQARRKSIVEKVTSDIVHRIIHDRCLAGAAENLFRPAENRPEESRPNGQDHSKLVFKVFDGERGEVRKTISMENPGLLRPEGEEC